MVFGTCPRNSIRSNQEEKMSYAPADLRTDRDLNNSRWSAVEWPWSGGGVLVE
jgi:hypothetical protein